MTEMPYKTFTGQSAPGVPLDYHIDKKKALLVDLAIKLGRPLLIEGEAGCGKTTLATAIASELGLGQPIIEPIRSTSRANDLFYRVDTLARLMDSNIASKQDKASDVQNYITLEPIGQAIVDGQKSVILIDEIDKADMDFQNDLLFALERFEFNIDEIPASETQELNGVSHRMSRKGGSKPIYQNLSLGDASIWS
jgi:MoxR-like ATPase